MEHFLSAVVIFSMGLHNINFTCLQYKKIIVNKKSFKEKYVIKLNIN